MKNKYYITAAIPYVNAKPHIGHALEFVQTDVIARYHKLLGEDVLMLSGGDENAVKNVQAAEAEKTPVQEFVDKNNILFQKLAQLLDAGFDIWQKGSDQLHHHPSSQKLWELCDKAGDIFKKSYEGLYCVGCEAFYTKEELNETGECYEHPGRKLDKISEENYFFKLSKYEKKLIKIIESDEIIIVPESRKNEILSFLRDGLHDLSISRSKKRAKNWGVPVPGDSSQIIYVWFDALNIYQSGVGFGWNNEQYKKYWPANLHVIGKGIIRFHAIYWPAFLLSAGLKLPKSIFVHDYFTVNGHKMSKTVGNVINPVNVINKYGVESLRYYLLAKFSPFSDGDFSESKLVEINNSDLANGIGNLVARTAKLCQTSGFKFPENKKSKFLSKGVVSNLDKYRFDIALKDIWQRIQALDKFIDKNKPWKQEGEALKKMLTHSVEAIREIAFDLKPFLPQTAQKIKKQFNQSEIKTSEVLFPRL